LRGDRWFLDNISFRNFATGLDAHSVGGYVNGFHLEGNVLFDNYEWGIFLSGKNYPIERLKIVGNFTYYKRTDTMGKGSVQAGYEDAVHQDVELRDNYFVLGPHDRSFYLKDFKTITLTGNTIVGPGLLARVSQKTKVAFEARKNAWFGGGAGPFKYRDKPLDFAGWQAATQTDADSTWSKDYPRDVKVFVRPNPFEPGRGHVIVYNWAVNKTVTADISGILPAGTRYEIRDAQNYYARPVAAGLYDGRAVSIPMDQKEIAVPIGDCPHIKDRFRPTAPEFGVFVVLPAGAVVCDVAK
jgi:hypothetical protein